MDPDDSTSITAIKNNINPDQPDVLVFTRNATLCSVSTSCIAAGNFTPVGNATYFANATVLYTLPTALTDAGAGEMRAMAINSMSATRARFSHC